MKINISVPDFLHADRRTVIHSIANRIIVAISLCESPD
jgi:hypothetical protein